MDSLEKGWQIMHRMGHGPGKGLGREEQGRHHPIEDEGNIGRLGLGYQLTKTRKSLTKWKLWDHFTQGPTEGETLEEPREDPEEGEIPLPLEESEEQSQIDYGLTHMFHTPEQGSSSSSTPHQTPVIPVDDPQNFQCFMLSVIDHQKKMPKFQPGNVRCPWKSSDSLEDTPLLRENFSLHL